MSVHGALRPVNTSHNVNMPKELTWRERHITPNVYSAKHNMCAFLVLSTKVNFDVPPL